MDLITSLKVKKMEGKRVIAHSPARIILGVEGRARAPRWD